MTLAIRAPGHACSALRIAAHACAFPECLVLAPASACNSSLGYSAATTRDFSFGLRGSCCLGCSTTGLLPLASSL